MITLAAQLENIITLAIKESLELDNALPLLMPTKDEKHGDYQCNAAMGLSKKLKQNPRQIGQKLAEAFIEVDKKLACSSGQENIIESCEVAGPGFVNIRLRDKVLNGMLNNIGSASAKRKEKVIVDYSCPNVAKQLHVGHLRSTIIGDAICRILGYLGYEVKRDNHVGDWGTQFGLLCAWIMDHNKVDCEDADLSDLEAIYRESQALAESDEHFRELSRARVVALHQGDPETLRVWRCIVDKSLEHIYQLYAKLNVLLTRDDVVGESFYNPMLPQVVADLQERFPAGSRPMEVVKNQGAVCVFMYNEDGTPLFTNPEGAALPLIIQKTDGAYLYATTDLACLRYRTQELKADWIIYTTDMRQSLHFKMFFAAGEKAGWAGRAKLEHVPFGSVLGPDNKPLKTRAGRNIHLADLIQEAIDSARRNIQTDGGRTFSPEEIEEIAEAVGVGAVKYADLSQNHLSDYVFSFDKMLAMEGNTAPYLLYAYARIRSIVRKAGQFELGEIKITHPAERRLLLQLARFNEVIVQVSDGWRINLLCDYLYNLSGLYMKFYENCPVLSAPEADIRGSRLTICSETARILQLGLGLLGLKTVERM
ncbi:MAG: arginine--tRNA ligase [Candidatus Bruticola sp.]